MNPYVFIGLNKPIQDKIAQSLTVHSDTDLQSILRIVSENTGVSVSDIKSKNRSRKISDARQLFLYFASNVIRDVVRVAAFVNRDHSTCSYAKKQVSNRYNGFGGRDFKKLYESIDKMVNIKTSEGMIGVRYRDSNYLVYPDGSIVNGRINSYVKPWKHKSGQWWVSLYINKKGVKKLVKSLVAECFIENPFDKKIIIHKDGNTINNCVDNLFWGDRKQQQKHILKFQLRKSKFDGDQILRIRSMKEHGKKNSTIAEIMGTSTSMVSLIVNKKIYQFYE